MKNLALLMVCQYDLMTIQKWITWPPFSSGLWDV